MLLALKQATGNVTSLAQEFRGISFHTLVSDEVIEDLNGVLQIGIQGFKCLVLAEQQNLMRLSLNGSSEVWESNCLAIQVACRRWLAVCSEIRDWNRNLSKTDQHSELAEFLQCVTEMESIVRFKDQDVDNESMPTWLLDLRDGAIREHARGETISLVQGDE